MKKSFYQQWTKRESKTLENTQYFNQIFKWVKLKEMINRDIKLTFNEEYGRFEPNIYYEFTSTKQQCTSSLLLPL